jgi:Leucine-rich repeat (LRR) protein
MKKLINQQNVYLNGKLLSSHEYKLKFDSDGIPIGFSSKATSSYIDIFSLIISFPNASRYNAIRYEVEINTANMEVDSEGYFNLL